MTAITKLPTKAKNTKNLSKLESLCKEFKYIYVVTSEILNSKSLHTIRENILPSKIFFGKNTIIKKVLSEKIKSKISNKTFLVLSNDGDLTEKIEDCQINGLSEIGEKIDLVLKKGIIKMDGKDISSIYRKNFQNLDIKLKDDCGSLFLEEDFEFGTLDREKINLLKFLKLKTKICHLKVEEFIELN